jgi:hypothetical protein
MTEIKQWDEVIIQNNINIIFDDKPEKGIVMDLYEIEDNYEGKQRRATVLRTDKKLVSYRVEKLEKTGKSYPEFANIFKQLEEEK